MAEALKKFVLPGPTAAQILPQFEGLDPAVQEEHRENIGAEPETTESVLALLADADLEVASIGLTDGTGTALAAGSLTLNASGDVVIHDNESNAEDLPHLVNSLESLNFGATVLPAAMDNVTMSRKLCDIPMSSGLLTDGKRLHIGGRIQSAWTSGNKPDTVVFLALCKEGQDPTSDGITFVFAEGVTSEDREFHLPVLISVASTTWTAALESARAMGFARKNNAGTITHSAIWELGVDLVDNTPISGTTGEPVKLELWLVTIDASDTVTAKLFIAGKLSVISQ